MFLMNKTITKQYYSFFKEMFLNLLFFIVFQAAMIFQTSISFIADSKEYAYAGLFSLFSVLFLVYLTVSKKHDEYNLEKINLVLFSSNIMYSISIILHFLNVHILIPFLNMSNFHYANIFTLSTISFLFFVLRYMNLSDYLIGARSDIMLKNSAYQKLRLNYKAISKSALRIDKSLSDDSVIAHEVGHLLFLLSLLKNDKEILISIVPDAGAKGFVLTNILENPQTKSEYESKMLYLVGGLAADYYEQAKSNQEIEVGAGSDMWKFSSLAASYLKNGFSKKTLFLNEVPDLSIEYISKHNKECMDYTYQTILKSCLIYIYQNKELYEDIKKLLKKEKVLYTEDLLEFKNRLQGEIKCDL